MNNKQKLSRKLFWSLVPTGVLGLLLYAIWWYSIPPTLGWNDIDGYMESSAMGKSLEALASVMLLTWVCFWAALVLAPIFRWMGNGEANQLYLEAQSYAQLNDWQHITTTSWRAQRSGGRIQMNIVPSVAGATFVLSIKTSNDDFAVTDGFERGLFAMEFGDWVVSYLTDFAGVADIVREQRREWESTRGRSLALQSGRPNKRNTGGGQARDGWLTWQDGAPAPSPEKSGWRTWGAFEWLMALVVFIVIVSIIAISINVVVAGPQEYNRADPTLSLDPEDARAAPAPSTAVDCSQENFAILQAHSIDALLAGDTALYNQINIKVGRWLDQCT